MRTVITGSSGFVGRSVAHALSGLPISIRCVSYQRPSRPARTDMELVSGDLRDAQFADKVAGDADMIIHLAGLAHVRADSVDYREFNVKATANLARAAARRGVQSFVFASSSSVYGECDGIPMKETSPCRPATEYGKSKLQAEEMLNELALDSHMNVIILRLSTVYGAQDPGNVSRLIRSVRRFGPFVVGRGTNLKSLTHVDNIAELVASLIHKDLPHFDVVNVSDPVPYSLSTIVETVASVTGDTRPVVRIPRGVAMAGAGITESLWGIAGRRPPISRDQVSKLTQGAIVDVSHLRDAYGFVSRVLLREGIQRTLGPTRSANDSAL